MPGERPNVLILVWDAARAENFSVYGYERPTTPNLERLAERFAVYKNCVSPATWTMPSIASFFSGTYPSTHRLVLDGDKLDARFTTLAEVLASAGYFTAKVTGEVPYVSDFTGLDRGFELSHAERESDFGRWSGFLGRGRALQATPEATPETEGSAARTGADPESFVRKVEADQRARSSWKGRLRWWLSGFADAGAEACYQKIRELWSQHADRPRFVYAHLMETHSEYRPRHEYRKRFVPERLRGRYFGGINQRPNPHAAGLVELDEDDFAILTGLYDGCIAYLDRLTGSLLDDLAERPDFDDTLVIVTADHGDCLGRHGVLGHQFVCYEELLRIPWLVKWPRSIGITGERAELVQPVDVLPTLCALLGVETPATCEGVDVSSATRDYAFAELLKPFARTAVLQGLHELAPQYRRAVLAVRDARHKLITYSNAAQDELYDLQSDPREQRNLLAVRPSERTPELDALEERMRAALGRRLDGWKDAAADIERRVHAGSSGAELTGEVEAQLRALGYLD